MKKKIVVLATFAALFSASAGAQTTSVRLSKEYEDCRDKARKFDDVEACASREIEKQVSSLQAVYKRVESMIDAGMRIRLSADQKIWEGYTDQHCSIVHAFVHDDGLCSVYAYAARVDALKILETHFRPFLNSRDSTGNNVSKPPVR